MKIILPIETPLCSRMSIGSNKKKTQCGGPKGKAKKLFEEIGNLPRFKQNIILSVFENLIAVNRIG